MISALAQMLVMSEVQNAVGGAVLQDGNRASGSQKPIPETIARECRMHGFVGEETDPVQGGGGHKIGWDRRHPTDVGCERNSCES